VRAAFVELADRGQIESVPGKDGSFAPALGIGARAGVQKAPVVEQLREELRSGNHSPGELFLSERDVGDRYGVTRHAARAALAVLEAA